MAKKPDDRPKEQPENNSEEEPKIYMILNGKKFPRPGLETFFADNSKVPSRDRKDGCSCHPVVGTYCKCNKVSVCTCAGFMESSSSSSGGSSGGGGCRCAPVH